MRMPKHDDVGCCGNLLAGYDFGLAKEIGNEVKGMDEKVEQSVTFWVFACEVMEVIIDKTLISKSFLEDLYSKGITFLQANHDDSRFINVLKVDEGIKFLQQLAGRLLDEQ